MTSVFTTDDLGRDYGGLLTQVLAYGERSAPRGLPIIEVIPYVLQLDDPTKCVAMRKGYSKALMWLEIASVMAGEFHMEQYERLSPQAASMLSAQGAYGPRTAEQMRYVVRELVRDPDSRRAVVYVGRPTDLAYSEHFEQPCTMTWQFLLRGGKLHMIVNMRSWDLVWGLGYDVPVFTSMQQVVAAALGVEVGIYNHVAGSGHIYERHWELNPAPAPDVSLPSMAPWTLRLLNNPVTKLESAQVDASHALRALDGLMAGKAAGVSYPSQWQPAIDEWRKALAKVQS